MKDTFTIGEIGKLYNLGSDSLRYYEKKGILKPQRAPNGYRLYTVDDIWRLNLIKSMRKLNFSIDDIQRYLSERTVDSTLAMIEEEMAFIDAKIAPLLAMKEDLAHRLEDLKKDRVVSKQEVVYKALPRREIMLLESAIEKEYEVDWAFRKLENKDETLLSLFANKHRGVFVDDAFYKEGVYTKYEAVFFMLGEAISGISKVLEEGVYATLTYVGDYHQSQGCFERLIKDMAEKGYKKTGKAMEIYKIDIHTTKDPREYVTEIQIPVKI